MEKRNLLSVVMTLLMAAFMSISFTACGSNDDNNPAPTDLFLVVHTNSQSAVKILNVMLLM